MANDEWVTTYTPPAAAPDAAAADDWATTYAPPPPATPTTAGALQTLRDTARVGSSAFGFGLVPRATAAIRSVTGDTYANELQKELALDQAARDRLGGPAATAADFVGGAALPLPLGGAAAAAKLGGGALARAAGYGLEGAGQGALAGAGTTYSGNPADYLRNAALGGAVGAGSGAVLGSAFAPRAARPAAAVPTPQETFNRAAADYAALRANPTSYDPMALGLRASQVESALNNRGLYAERAPGAFKATDQMQTGVGIPGAIVTPANVDYIRQGLNMIPKGEASARDRLAGRSVRQALDDFVANPPPGAVLPGNNPADVAEAARLSVSAPGNYAATSRGQKLLNMTQAADDATTGFGLASVHRAKNFINPDTATGVSKAAASGFSAPEIDALREQMVQRSRIANTLHAVGSAMGGGKGLAAATAGGVGAGLGAAYGGGDPVTTLGGALALPLTGVALRGAGNMMARNAMNRVVDQVMTRSPLYAERVAATGGAMAPGAGPLSAENVQRVRNALTLGLLQQQQPDAQ